MNLGINVSILLMKEGFNRTGHKHEIKTFMINKKWSRVSLKVFPVNIKIKEFLFFHIISPGFSL